MDCRWGRGSVKSDLCQTFHWGQIPRGCRAGCAVRVEQLQQARILAVHFDGQIGLLFDPDTRMWTEVHPGASWMKTTWENDRQLTEFLRMVSMGDCPRWLGNFSLPWEEMLESTGRVTELQRQRERSSIPWVTLQMAATAGAALIQSLGVSSPSPTQVQGPEVSGQLLLGKAHPVMDPSTGRLLTYTMELNPYRAGDVGMRLISQ